MVYLYDLKFRGCVSCMACKLKKEPRPCRCIRRDDLATVLDKVHEADAVVLGSPIYFSEVTGEMRSLFERFLFQYLNYDDYSKPLSPAKKMAFIFTMNIPESMFDDFGYRPLFQRYENWMKLYFGHCETLLSTDTLQVKGYSRYHLAGFDSEAKHLRHETVFPQDCQRAFELGKRLVEKESFLNRAKKEVSRPAHHPVGLSFYRIFPLTVPLFISGEAPHDDAVDRLRRLFLLHLKGNDD